MKKLLITNTDAFLETYEGEQILTLRFGLKELKSSFMIYPDALKNFLVCKTAKMTYYRWLFFELDIPN